jgi:hypothetical protein
MSFPSTESRLDNHTKKPVKTHQNATTQTNNFGDPVNGDHPRTQDTVMENELPEFLCETADLDTIKKRYGISLPKLYDWFEQGLPSMKIGRRRLVHVPTADAWVKAKLTGNTAR